MEPLILTAGTTTATYSRLWLLLLFALILLSTPLKAELRIESGPARVALLELYTSEGCSSCPPAERWLSGLKQDPALWTKVVPVAFHVDYWDYIGWKDRFAKPEFGARQRAYAAEGGVRTVYTPGLILNGKEWRGWIMNRPPVSDALTAGRLAIRIDGEAITVDYTASGKSERNYAANIALLAFEQVSDVGAGENKGRTLNNDFVVLSLQKQSLHRREGKHSLQSTLAADLPGAGRRAVAVWITQDGTQQPLQAAGGWLFGEED
jgi:hypothetical protein